MVSQVSTAQALRYIQGTPICETTTSVVEEAASTAKSQSIFSALPGIGFIFKNKGNSLKVAGEMMNDYGKLIGEGHGGISGALKYGSSTSEGISLLRNINKTTESLTKTIAKGAKEGASLKAINAASDATTKLNELSPTLNTIKSSVEGALKNTDAKAAKKAINAASDSLKATTTPGIVRRALGHIPGFNKLANTALGKAISRSGAGTMILFDSVIQLATEVVPAFKNLGAGEGVKQIGKSAVQVGAYAAGYVGGAKLGGMIGTAICPGIGTLVGGVVGFIGGMVGGAIASGIAKKITGPNASEKIAKKQEEEQAAMVEQDPQAMAELQQLVAQQVAQDQAAGNVTEDTQRMAAYAQTANTASTATYAAPTFTGTTSTTGATNTIDTTGTYNPFTTSSMYNGNITLADPNMYAVPSSHYEQQSNFSAVA